MQCDFETFSNMFAVILEYSKTADSNGLLTRAYYELLTPTDPTSDEVWAAISAHIDNQRPSLPTGKALKDSIYQLRRKALLALPAAPIAVEVGVADDRKVAAMRAAQISFMAGFYKHQGDTPLYRKMLTGKAGVWGAVAPGKDAVSHDEVIEFLQDHREAA
jgi:hypothetical protein